MKRLLNLIKIPTTKDVITNIIGNTLGVFFTAIYFLVFVRVLSRTELGVLSVLFAIAYVLANILDFGVTASIYSYLPPLLINREETLKFLKANFLFQTSLSTVVLVVFFIFIKPIDNHFLKLHAPISYYVWTFISIPLFIWQNFALNVLYATKKFLYANIISNVANIIKTGILLLLVYTNHATVQNIIITLGVVGQLLFIIPLFNKRKELLKDIIEIPFDRSKIVLNYTVTYFLASQFFYLATRVDLFLLSFYLPLAQVGDYGIAQKILLTIITLVASITQVLSPQFSKVVNRAEAITLLKKSFIYMLFPVGVFFLTIVLPTSIYTLLLTEKLVRSAAITRLLSSAYILYALIAVPTLFFLYTIRKPIHLFYMNAMILIIMAIGCYFLIPLWGVLAPPLVFAFAFTLAGIYAIIVLPKELKKINA